MYERFYHLRERPFALTPDPDYLYPSRAHTEALSYLRYGIEGQAGFTVITGEIGCGKTTLLQTLLRGLSRQTSVSRIVNTMLDGRELIEAVMLDFGLDPGHGRSKPHLVHELAQFLVDQRMAGRLALLVIDEAQNLSLPALEEVRMLSNLETEKSKLVQVVLVGQPNLRTILDRPDLEQLRQRVTVSYHLQALDAPETAEYINHRLRRAAIGAPLEFSRDVTDLIHLHAEGIPRKINVIADAVLLFGYGEDQHRIDVDLTHEVIDELESTGVIVQTSRGQASLRSAQASVTPPTKTPPDAELARREARINERERQLIEQQRVLSEEYRLLRQPPTSDAAALPSPWHAQAASPSTEKAAAIPSVQPVQPTPPPAPARAAAVQPVPGRALPRTTAAPARLFYRQPPRAGVWTRMRRSLFGMPKPLLED